MIVRAAVVTFLLLAPGTGTAALTPSAPHVPGMAEIQKALDAVRNKPETHAQRVEESRLLFYLAQSKPETDVEARRKLFEDGLDLAETARRESPDDPAAVTWWAAHYGALADLKRNPWSLKAVLDIEKELKRISPAAQAYGFDAVDRALGRVYLKAPRFFSVGSTTRAEERMRRAVAASPDYPGNQLGLAEVLFEQGKKDEAARIARTVVKSAAFQKDDFGEFSFDKMDWQKTIAMILPAGSNEGGALGQARERH